MKVRLYDGGKKWGVDRYTFYFPFPKWMREDYYNRHRHVVTGTMIGCSEGSDGGVIRCIWEDMDLTLGYSIRRLGRKIPIENMSKQFQKWARRLEKLWNDALKYDDKKHWDKWNQA